jgi:hypothetical protein
VADTAATASGCHRAHWRRWRHNLAHVLVRTLHAVLFLGASLCSCVQDAQPVTVCRSAQQRFFKLLCVSLKTPTVVEAAKKALADGCCVVIGLQSTGVPTSCARCCACVVRRFFCSEHEHLPHATLFVAFVYWLESGQHVCHFSEKS